MFEIKKYCFITVVILFINYFNLAALEKDHDKAIEAVKSGEILPLDQILVSIKDDYEGLSLIHI